MATAPAAPPAALNNQAACLPACLPACQAAARRVPCHAASRPAPLPGGGAVGHHSATPLTRTLGEGLEPVPRLVQELGHLRGLARPRLAAEQDHVVAPHRLHDLLLHADDGQVLPGFLQAQDTQGPA